MIENVNKSKVASTGEYLDIKKYIGVASVNVVSVNPNNAALRKYGWTIEDGANEPNYVSTLSDGSTAARVRFLMQIQDLDGKPIVPIDFWIRPGIRVNGAGTKCQIIDAYGRTAWATKEEAKAHRVPQYANGPASISSNYKPCHPGEEELVSFIMKYLNITPLQVFDKKTNGYVNSPNPGKLTIDNWDRLIKGDATEIAQYLSLQPENCVKVIFGVQTTDDNKSYQTVLKNKFISNATRPDRASGEYTLARKAIDEFTEGSQKASNFNYSALPVKEWSESASSVEDNSGKMFDDNGNFVADDPNDLPF